MRLFKAAVAYAKTVLANPMQREYWEKEAKKLGRSAYHLLVSRYMKEENKV